MRRSGIGEIPPKHRLRHFMKCLSLERSNAPHRRRVFIFPQITMGTAWTRRGAVPPGLMLPPPNRRSPSYWAKKIGPGAAKTDKKERTPNTKHQTPNPKSQIDVQRGLAPKSPQIAPKLQSSAKLKLLWQFRSKRADLGFRLCIRRSSGNGRPSCPCNSRRSDRNTPQHPIALANP